jgi:hypothetical protein
MLVLTAILLLLLRIAFGLARRPWWEIGILAFLSCGVLQATEFWIGDWRRQVGLLANEHLFQSNAIAWLLVGFGAYVCYGMAFLYSRRHLARGSRSNR